MVRDTSLATACSAIYLLPAADEASVIESLRSQHFSDLEHAAATSDWSVNPETISDSLVIYLGTLESSKLCVKPLISV